MQRLAVPRHRALGTQRDDEAFRHLLDGRDGALKVVALTPLKGLGLITEHQLHTALDHRGHIVAKELHHARIRKADGGLHTVYLGERFGFQRGGVAGRGGHQIAFEIHPLGVLDSGLVNFAGRQCL